MICVFGRKKRVGKSTDRHGEVAVIQRPRWWGRLRCFPVVEGRHVLLVAGAFGVGRVVLDVLVLLVLCGPLAATAALPRDAGGGRWRVVLPQPGVRHALSRTGSVSERDDEREREREEGLGLVLR